LTQMHTDKLMGEKEERDGLTLDVYAVPTACLLIDLCQSVLICGFQLVGLNAPTVFTKMLYPFFPQQCLYFFPLPQGQGSLRPTLGPVRIGLDLALAAAAAAASVASVTMSLGFFVPGGGVGFAAPKEDSSW
jgi:hypothetical protein